MAQSFKTLFLAFLASSFLALSVQAQSPMSHSSGSIGFKALEKKDVKAEATDFTSSINLVDKSVSFTVPIDNFEFKSGLMKKHYLAEGVMNALNFPNATFVGDILADSDLSQDGLHDVQAEGQMTILETTLNVLVNGVIEIQGGTANLRANFMVNGKEYGIDSKKVDGFVDQMQVMVDVVYGQ